MVKTIFHVIGSSRNYGDMAIQYSMINMLQKTLGKPIQFIPIDYKKPIPIHSAMVDLINDMGDMLLVGGGGLIMKGDGFDTLSGWQFNISYEDLRRLRVPLVVYGVGYNLFPGERTTEDPKTVQHLLQTCHQSDLFSVRDKGSMKALQKLGLGDMDVIPDPAMFCSTFNPDLPGIDKDEFLIGLNWAGDRLEKRFSEHNMSDVVSEVCKILLRLLKEKGGGRIVFIPHVDKYDRKMAKMFKKRLPNGIFYDISKHLPYLYPESLVNVPVLLGVYKKMDFVLGMRGHSNIFAFGQHIPFLGFGEHKKNIFFADEVNNHIIDNSCKNLDKRFRQIVGNPSYSAIMRSRLRDFKKEIDSFNRRVVSLL